MFPCYYIETVSDPARHAMPLRKRLVLFGALVAVLVAAVVLPALLAILLPKQSIRGSAS